MERAQGRATHQSRKTNIFTPPLDALHICCRRPKPSETLQELFRKQGRDPTSDGSCFCCVGQSVGGFTTMSAEDGVLPTLTKAGRTRIWIPKHKRWLTAREKLHCMLFPVDESCASAAGVPVLNIQDVPCAHGAIGNSMHVGCMTIMMVAVLANVELRHEKPAKTLVAAAAAPPAKPKLPENVKFRSTKKNGGVYTVCFEEGVKESFAVKEWGSDAAALHAAVSFQAEVTDALVALQVKLREDLRSQAEELGVPKNGSKEKLICRILPLKVKAPTPPAPSVLTGMVHDAIPQSALTQCKDGAEPFPRQEAQHVLWKKVACRWGVGAQSSRQLEASKLGRSQRRWMQGLSKGFGQRSLFCSSKSNARLERNMLFTSRTFAFVGRIVTLEDVTEDMLSFPAPEPKFAYPKNKDAAILMGKFVLEDTVGADTSLLLLAQAAENAPHCRSGKATAGKYIAVHVHTPVTSSTSAGSFECDFSGLEKLLCQDKSVELLAACRRVPNLDWPTFLSASDKEFFQCFLKHKFAFVLLVASVTEFCAFSLDASGEWKDVTANIEVQARGALNKASRSTTASIAAEEEGNAGIWDAMDAIVDKHSTPKRRRVRGKQTVDSPGYTPQRGKCLGEPAADCEEIKDKRELMPEQNAGLQVQPEASARTTWREGARAGVCARAPSSLSLVCASLVVKVRFKGQWQRLLVGV